MMNRMKNKRIKQKTRKENNPYTARRPLYKEDMQAVIKLVLDIVAMGLGLVIIFMTVVTFLSPGSRRGLFPLIFLLGAVLNGVTAAKYFYLKNRFFAVIFAVAGVLLCVTAAVSYFFIQG